MNYPTGFRLYADVVNRLGEVRAVGDGLTFQCHFPDRHTNGDAHPSARSWIGDAGELCLRCLGCGATWREFASSLGIPLKSFFPTRDAPKMNADQPKPKPVATYTYRHADGSLYGTKTRLEPGYNGRKKDFAWSRPVPDDIRLLAGITDDAPAVVDGPGAMGKGSFVASMWADGWHFRKTENSDDPKAVLLPAADDAPLFMLPELLASRKDRPVFLVDGEKAVMRMRSLGFTAVCGSHGCTCWVPAMYEDHFAGRSIIVVPDNDYASIREAMHIVGTMIDGGAKQVRFLRPGHCGYEPPANGGGIDDWLDLPPNGSWKPAAELKAAVVDLCKRLPRYDFSQPERTA